MSLGEEMGVVKGNIQDLLKERNKWNTIVEELKLLKDNILIIDNRLHSVAKMGEEFGNTSQRSETEGPNESLEDIRKVVNNLLELSLNQVFEKVNAHQEEVDRLMKHVVDMKLKMKMTN